MPACDPENFVNREEELSHVQKIIAGLKNGSPFGPHERVIHFIGPSGIGKSCLLEKCISVSGAPDQIPILLSLKPLLLNGDDFVTNFLLAVDREICIQLGISGKKHQGSSSSQILTGEVLKKIRNLKGKVFMLYLDETDSPHKNELRKIEEHLLERLLEENRHTVLITAGRKRPELNVFSLRSNAANTFSLPPFDQETTGEQLGKLKPGSEILADKVFDLGGGVPGNNWKLSELVVGSPPQIPKELQAVQSLLADVKSEIDKRFHPIIEAICVLTSFDPDDVAPLLESHPELGNEWRERNIRDIFTKLKQVRLGPGGLINWDREERSWAMDEPIRALFERELQMRDPVLWKKLHCTASRMFRQWGEEYDSSLYRDKAAHHQQCLQSAELNCDDNGKEG